MLSRKFLTAPLFFSPSFAAVSAFSWHLAQVSGRLNLNTGDSRCFTAIISCDEPWQVEHVTSAFCPLARGARCTLAANCMTAFSWHEAHCAFATFEPCSASLRSA